jgi:hypothetical protein
MNFAGRSREITDVTEYLAADRDCRVLVSTDGFNDVWRYCTRQSLLGSARDVFARYPVDRICEVIHGILEDNRDRFEHDDIGFIIFDPFRTERIGGTAVLMGGTQPHEERRYRSEYASGQHDRWASGGDWSGSADEFAGAGIRVLSPTGDRDQGEG